MALNLLELPYKLHLSEEVLFLLQHELEAKIERIKSLLDPIDIHASADEFGNPLYHYAALFRNKPVAQYLLDRGYRVDNSHLWRLLPLILTPHCNFEGTIEIHLQAGVDIEAVNPQSGKSSLEMVLSAPLCSLNVIRLFLENLRDKYSDNVEEMVRKLIDAGCQIYQAVILKDSRILELMIEAGCSVNSSHPICKWTALHESVDEADLKSVKLLLKHKANVNAEDIHENTPIYFLYGRNKKCNKRRLKILKVLMKAGATVTNSVPQAPFQVTSALLHGDREVIRFLLKSGVDFTVESEWGKSTLLHYIGTNGNSGLVEILQAHIDKFDVNVVDRFKRSPLLTASKFGNVDMMKFLLDQGAIADQSCLCLACQGSQARYDECVELLLQHDVDPQFVKNGPNDEVITIFDFILGNKRRRYIVEHIAMLEKIGKPLIDIIQEKIDSNPSMKKHYNGCRRMLEKKIGGCVTVFQLLTADEKRMAKYLNNPEVILELTRLSFLQKVKLVYPYYCNTISKGYIKGMHYKMLKEKGAAVIWRMSQGRVGKDSVVIDKVIDYLDVDSLQCLQQVEDAVRSLKSKVSAKFFILKQQIGDMSLI